MIKADTFIHAVHIQITLSETVNGQKVTGHKVTICIGQKVTINIFVFYICFGFPRLVYYMLLVSLDSPFLIAPSVFSNVYAVVLTENGSV